MLFFHISKVFYVYNLSSCAFSMLFIHDIGYFIVLRTFFVLIV